MSKFYGQVEGMSSTMATRRGGKFIKTSAQSYNGSIQTRLEYDDSDNLIVEMSMCEGTGFYGDRVFRGRFVDLKDILTHGELYKRIMDELIDNRIETYGITETIQWLYQSGVSIVQLRYMSFADSDIKTAVEQLESEAV
jgi:hypothetical protein